MAREGQTLTAQFNVHNARAAECRALRTDARIDYLKALQQDQARKPTKSMNLVAQWIVNTERAGDQETGALLRRKFWDLIDVLQRP